MSVTGTSNLKPASSAGNTRRCFQRLVMRRVWDMPAADTFDVPSIRGFVKKHLLKSQCSIDPFARNKRWATHTNDLNPDTAATHHMKALDFLKMLREKGVQPDLVIFDPPYSVQQCKTSYAGFGATFGQEEVSMAWGGWSEEKKLISEIAPAKAIVLSFGWSSIGMGKGWTQNEILLVCHGAGHNDTICVSESKDEPHPSLFAPHNAEVSDHRREKP